MLNERRKNTERATRNREERWAEGAGVGSRDTLRRGRAGTGESVMLPTTDLLANMVDGLREELKMVVKYRCPDCEKEFDIEEVRRFTDNGEAPTCMECGKVLEPVEGGD